MFIERLHQEFVGQRLSGILSGDELLDRLTDASVRNLSAVAGLIAGGEERAHFHETMRGEHVFPGDRPRNGGGVETQFVGDVVHRQWSQVAMSLIEERRLVLDEFVGDGENGFLAERNGVDQAAAVADLVAEKLAGFRVGAGFADHVFVEIVDPQIGEMFAGEPSIPISIIIALNDDIRQNVGIAGRVIFAARIGGQTTNARGSFGDALDGGAKCAGDLRMALAGEILQMIADDFVFDGVLAGGAFELQQQRLRNPGSADPGGVEGLDERQCFSDDSGLEAHASAQRFHWEIEETTVIKIA